MLIVKRLLYLMSFMMSLFGVVATQKNIRDLNYLRLQTELNLAS